MTAQRRRYGHFSGRWRASRHFPLPDSGEIVSGLPVARNGHVRDYGKSGVLMYKVASKNQQHAAAALRWSDLAGGEEVMTPEQEREAILTAMPALEARIAAAAKDERAVLGKRKLELQERLGELRKQIHSRRHKGQSISQFFQSVCKERLPKWQYEMLVRAALDRMDEAQVQPEDEGAEG